MSVDNEQRMLVLDELQLQTESKCARAVLQLIHQLPVYTLHKIEPLSEILVSQSLISHLHNRLKSIPKIVVPWERIKLKTTTVGCKVQFSFHKETSPWFISHNYGKIGRSELKRK